MWTSKRFWLASLLLGAATGAWAQGLALEVAQGRNQSLDAQIDQALVRLGAESVASASAQRRGRTAFAASPVAITLYRDGVKLPFQPRGRAGDLSLEFDTTGTRVFPTSYRQHLEATFTQAKATMDAIYGPALRNVTIRVRNYDADLPDRAAVAGGAFVANAPDGPEIRFPVYNNSTAASIHFIHCMLLAYQADWPYPIDSFQEGLARAATIQVARTTGALPNSPSIDAVNAVLDAAYDVSTFYDWWNQPSLAAPRFIAPNLVSTPLPAGGSTGGIFLLRFQMAGTAWNRLLAEVPGFLVQFNARYQLSPASYPNEASLVALGQVALDAAAGRANATVEGKTFAQWFEEQRVLDSDLIPGPKLHVQAFPLDPTPGSSDFGVFAIVANAFQLEPNGNETLFGGRAFPVYWREDGTRFLTSVQDDVLEIAGAYGSVAPNFPATSGTTPYRTLVDVPFAGMLTRLSLPAGSFATGSSPVPRNLYGTVRGVPSTGNYVVRVTSSRLSGPVDIPVQRFAFGTTISDANFTPAQPLRIQVFRDNVQVIDRLFNKGYGPVALDLRGAGDLAPIGVTLPAGLSLYAPIGTPYRHRADRVLGLAENQTLLGRWSPSTGQFDLFPNEGGMMAGRGAYLALGSAVSTTVLGVRDTSEPVSIPLEPGWNMVANPLNEDIPFSRITVTTTTEAPATYSQAQGTIIGTTMFGFGRDNVNIYQGSLTPLSSVPGGAAFWVRCDRTEGAIMTFTPSSFGAGTRTGGNVAEPKPDWEMIVKVMGGGHSSRAFIGQARRASDTFDRAWDSGMPPLAGGLQVQVGPSLYRDIRGAGRAQTYRVTLTGLRPGTEYKLMLGRKLLYRAATLTDRRTGASKYYPRGGTYTFRATQETHEFDLRTGTGR